jgi:uncharacterized protein (TIGR01777 family)
MNIIITGGTGVIGRALTSELAQAGHKVTIFSRNPKKPIEGAQIAPWDLENPKSWLPHIENADAVVHLAGENLAGEGFFPTRWTAERKRRIIDSRVNTGKILVEAIRQAKNKPEVFIQASAIGYYGSHGDETLSENNHPGNDFLAQTCVQWENSTEEMDDMGVRRAIIRTGIVLTPDSGALARLLLPYRMFAGGPFGDGKQWYSWIHIADEVAAIRFLIEDSGAAGAFNLAAPQPLPNRDFGKTLGKVLKRPSLIPVPKFIMKAAFGEVATVVLDGQRVSRKKLQELGYEFKFPALEPALRALLNK